MCERGEILGIPAPLQMRAEPEFSIPNNSWPVRCRPGHGWVSRQIPPSGGPRVSRVPVASVCPGVPLAVETVDLEQPGSHSGYSGATTCGLAEGGAGVAAGFATFG